VAVIVHDTAAEADDGDQAQGGKKHSTEHHGFLQLELSPGEPGASVTRTCRFIHGGGWAPKTHQRRVRVNRAGQGRTPRIKSVVTLAEENTTRCDVRGTCRLIGPAAGTDPEGLHPPEEQTMKAAVSRTILVALAAALVLMAGCSGSTTIKSDLVLAGNGSARLDLHRKTEAINLFNDSDVPVRIKVLGKRDRVYSNMLLNGHDRVRLDLANARAVEFGNENDEQALIRWILTNHDRIEYSMAIDP